MTLNEVVMHFGSKAKTAQALSITRQAVNTWTRYNRVPMLQQYKIEKVTKGLLKADIEDCSYKYETQIS